MGSTLNQKKLWEAALAELEIALSRANFTTWFKNTSILEINGENIVIGVPNTFAQEWLQNKYHQDILSILTKLYPQVTNIQYKVTTTADKSKQIEKKLESVLVEQTIEKSEIPVTQDIADTDLNPSYIFDTFVVGSSNRLAYAAAQAVVKKLGDRSYNPLYIYGGVGLGKTHLLQAVGNEIKKKQPKKVVIYSSCEKFASEFVEALQSKKLETFKKKYRNADVLLIDDIQFLSRKEGTQEEFFHTFNTLYQTNRQIIMTSDTKPQSIPQLAPRLSSRFGSGMVVDIKSPDFETRQAILQHKLEERGFNLDEKSIDYIAKSVQNNVRELEGIVNKIIAHCELYNIQPNFKLIETITNQLTVDNRNVHISADDISKTIAEYYNVALVDLMGKRRHKELVYPRQILMYLLRREMGYSYPKIGRLVGGKDHTTVIHGVEKIEKKIQKDEILQRDIALIKEQLYSF